MALCHAALAADALERPTPDNIGGYQALEHAAALLRASRSAPALAARVAAALEEQAPDFALEALAAPLAARATRAAGRRVLRQLLWARDATTGALSPRLRDREAFLAAAAPLLTAVEAAALVLEAPRHVPRTPAAAAAAGVALLAGGFASRAPRTVRAAARALAAVPPPPRRRRAEADAVDGPEAAAAAEIAAATLADEVAVARAVAAMLLGDTEGAAAVLRLDAPEAAGSPAGVAAFVGSHAGRLAGLVALAEAWLADVALPRHRDTAAAPRTLAAWFDAPPVVTGLAAFERPQPLRALGEAAATAAERRAAAADDAAGAAPDYESGASAGAAPGPGTALGPPRAAGRGGLAAMGGAAVTLVVLLAGAALASRAGAGNPAAAAAQRVTVAAVAAAGATAESIAEAATAAMRRGAAAPMDAQLAGAVVRRWQTVKAAALGGRHDVAALDTILEARRTGGFAKCGAKELTRAWFLRRAPCCASGGNAPRTCATTASTGAPAIQPDVMRDAAWSSDVRCFRWCREYILNGLNVDSLSVTPDGSRATVDATLTEAAVLHDGGAGAADADAYESTYRARYTLVRRQAPGAFGARAWRVVSGTVLY
jgi:hypothetical protein